MTPVSELQGFLPHSDEMVWIDYVVLADATGGSSMVVIDKNKHYCDGNTIRQSAYVEWMAQGFGFVNAKHARDSQSGSSVATAFLVGFTNVNFSSETPSDKEEILISTHVKRTIGPISYIDGVVKSKNSGVIYCEGQLKLFSN